MPSSVATAQSVATDGVARPSSICEIRLGETSVRAARPRTLNPAASRSWRIRAPRVSGTLSPTLPDTTAGLRPGSLGHNSTIQRLRGRLRRPQVAPACGQVLSSVKRSGQVMQWDWRLGPLASDVVIIGGTSGLGRSLAEAYVARGARVRSAAATRRVPTTLRPSSAATPAGSRSTSRNRTRSPRV